MPTRASTPCKDRTCPGVVKSGSDTCTEGHPQRGLGSGPDLRPTAHQRGYDSDWRKLRQMVLNRSPLCADPFGVHGPSRPTVALDVDHIIPLSQGGTNHFENLQPLCRSCHVRKTAGEARRGGMVSHSGQKAKVIVVCGPPGSGKTTYVLENKAWGDLVLDVDGLFTALSGNLGWYEHPGALLPFVLEARDAVIDRLTRPSELGRAWVITAEGDMTKVRALAHRLQAELLILDVDRLECVRRISQDDRRAKDYELWSGLVNKWWQSYEAIRSQESLKELHHANPQTHGPEEAGRNLSRRSFS